MKCRRPTEDLNFFYINVYLNIKSTIRIRWNGVSCHKLKLIVAHKHGWHDSHQLELNVDGPCDTRAKVFGRVFLENAGYSTLHKKPRKFNKFSLLEGKQWSEQCEILLRPIFEKQPRRWACQRAPLFLTSSFRQPCKQSCRRLIIFIKYALGASKAITHSFFFVGRRLNVRIYDRKNGAAQQKKKKRIGACSIISLLFHYVFSLHSMGIPFIFIFFTTAVWLYWPSRADTEPTCNDARPHTILCSSLK